jgi:hypothetical protein
MSPTLRLIPGSGARIAKPHEVGGRPDKAPVIHRYLDRTQRGLDNEMGPRVQSSKATSRAQTAGHTEIVEIEMPIGDLAPFALKSSVGEGSSFVIQVNTCVRSGSFGDPSTVLSLLCSLERLNGVDLMPGDFSHTAVSREGWLSGTHKPKREGEDSAESPGYK